MKLSAFVSVQGSVAVPATARHLSDDDVISELTRGAFEVIERPGQRRRVVFDLSHARATVHGIAVFAVVLAVSIASSGTWPPWWVIPVLLSLTFLAGQLTTSMSAPYWIRRAISDAMERRELRLALEREAAV